MNTFVKIGETRYQATVDGTMQNRLWDNRESKAATLNMGYAAVAALFVNGLKWSVVQECTVPVIDETTGQPTGETKTVTDEYDNSALNVLGDIVARADGTCTVYMGKPTDMENLLNQIYGGNA